MPSIILALMTAVGLSVIPSKGPVFSNSLSMMDLKKSPRAEKHGSKVNLFFSEHTGHQTSEPGSPHALEHF